MTVPSASLAEPVQRSVPAQRGLRPFWRAVLFFLPLAIVFGIPALVLSLSGELTHPDTVVTRQSRGGRDIIYGTAYTNSAVYMKARRIRLEQPRLLALGNSRVMQFRAEHFLPGARFYNAGGCVHKIRQFRAFLERLPVEALPATLIVATDTGFFTTGFDKLDKDEFNIRWLDKQLIARPSASEIFTANWRTVWADTADGKVKFRRFLDLSAVGTRIGLPALCKDKGYRNDGSYLYSELEQDIANPAHKDYGFKNTLENVAKGRARFAWDSAPNPHALAEVDALLDFCARHHVAVIGFLPPHPHAVWAAMQALGEKYAYVAKLEPELRRRFEQHGAEFYDFSDFAMVGAPDTEAIDGLHGSDRVYLRLVVAMLERGSRLNAQADLPALRAKLQSDLSVSTAMPSTPADKSL